MPTRAIPASPAAAPATAAWALDRSTFDTAVDPCDDFYNHVCGSFSRRPIPADRTALSWNRDATLAQAERTLERLLAGTGPAADPELGRLRTFYAACMADDAARDRSAAPILARWMTRIDAIATRADVQAAMRELQAIGVHPWLEYESGRDPAVRDRYRGELSQGRLGLRVRVLVDPSPQGAARRDAYRASIARMFELAGAPPERAARDAGRVLEVETALAAASPGRDEPDTEHPMTPDAMRALAPHVEWAALFALIGHPAGRVLNVEWPRYVQVLDQIVARRSVDDLRAVLRWRLLDELSDALPSRLAAEHADFRVQAGAADRLSKAQRCRLATIKGLGVELSRQFATSALGPEARATATRVVATLQGPIAAQVAAASWLSADARAATAERVRKLDLKIGYPDTWPATGTFPLDRGAHLENVIAAQTYEQARTWRRVHATWRRSDWEMTVFPNEATGMAAARLMIPNGFPDLPSNSIILTAAELEPPMFDAAAPPEVQYAGFGRLVGHETAHVLDMYQFDAEGVMRDTWSAPDVEARKARRACVMNQADQFEIPGVGRVNGAATVSENVADLAGVAFAYDALSGQLGGQMSQKGDDGFTRSQRFFIAYAQHWCAAQTPAAAAEDLRNDPHAPAQFRVNGPLANLPAFAAAFACRAGAKMVRPPADRCAVW